jgi:hypothetical protein
MCNDGRATICRMGRASDAVSYVTWAPDELRTLGGGGNFVC